LVADIIAKSKAKQDHIDSFRDLTSKELQPLIKTTAQSQIDSEKSIIEKLSTDGEKR
jgi:hypothetical protein